MSDHLIVVDQYLMALRELQQDRWRIFHACQKDGSAINIPVPSTISIDPRKKLHKPDRKQHGSQGTQNR